MITVKEIIISSLQSHMPKCIFNNYFNKDLEQIFYSQDEYDDLREIYELTKISHTEMCNTVIQLRKYIENHKSKNDIFVEHIEQHIKDMNIKSFDSKVICKICNKTIDEIYLLSTSKRDE